jgi:hypothetical protein
MIVALALTAFALADGPVVTPRGGDEAPKEDAAAVDDSVVPKEQAEAFKAFSGTWRCDGKANTELAEDVATKVTIAFKSELGRFVNVKIEAQKSKQNPHAPTSLEIWGYSQALGGFVRNGADSEGGFYAGTSSGWVGDRFWWSTDTVQGGKKVKLKDTFTRTLDAKGNVTGLVFERALESSGDASARVFFEGTCKR